MKKIAIVIGATGLIGQALIEALVHAQHIDKVRVLTRRPFKHPSLKVECHVIDFEHLEDYAILFAGDILFSALGTTIKQAGSVAAQRKVDLEYQFKAVQLAQKMGVSHYLLVSSSGANAHSKNPYLKMKGELEDKVKQLVFPCISIFQPSLLVGHRVKLRLGEKFASWILSIICILPRLKRYRPITGKQVATKMVQVSRQLGAGIDYFKLDEIFTK